MKGLLVVGLFRNTGGLFSIVKPRLVSVIIADGELAANWRVIVVLIGCYLSYIKISEEMIL